MITTGRAVWCCLVAVVATTKMDSVSAFVPPSTFVTTTNKAAVISPVQQQSLLWPSTRSIVIPTAATAGTTKNQQQQQQQRTQLSMSAIVDVAAAQDSILHSPTLWSVLAMTSIVGLLVAWEETIHNLRHNTPEPILPVIDSMLAEVGGLGFIGLFLSTIVTGGPLGGVVGGISEEYLGDEELLLESFEFLHTFFFQVGILFFVVAGVCVGAVLEEVNQLEEISALALDADGDGEVTLDELAEALQVDSIVIDTDGDGILSEEEKIDALKATSTSDDVIQLLFAERAMNEVDRAGECLVARERILSQKSLPNEFAIENYFERIFGHNLEEIVELSPVIWLPLIPLIALDNSVDLSRDVVSASSSNAFESCGYFYETPWVFYPTIFFQGLSLTWALFNFWKTTVIKKMLLATLVTDGVNGEATLLPPRYEIDELRKDFNSSPSIFGWTEQFLSGGGSKVAPPRNKHEELFGAVGSKFEVVYRDSIRFSTWMCVSLLVYSTTQVVLRDGAALFTGAEVGNPEGLVPELVAWSIFTASAIFQLALAPTTILNYSFVTSVEEYVKDKVITKTLKEVAAEREEVVVAEEVKLKEVPLETELASSAATTVVSEESPRV